MGFNLRSQTPFDKKQPSITDKVISKQSLNQNGESETRYYRGGLEVSAGESNVLKNKEKQKATQKRQDYERSQPNEAVQSLMDPTGISQWGQAKRGLVDLAKMTGSAIGMESQKGYDWDTSRAIGDAFDIAGAIPLIGKAKAAQQGFKLVKSVAKPVAGKVVKKIVAHATPTVGTAATHEYNKSKKK